MRKFILCSAFLFCNSFSQDINAILKETGLSKDQAKTILQKEGIKIPDDKSPTDFGGGKGSGGGAAETAINESLQCFYSSILFNTSATKLSDKKPGFSPTMEDLKAQIDYCHTQASASGTVYTASNFEEQRI